MLPDLEIRNRLSALERFIKSGLTLAKLVVTGTLAIPTGPITSGTWTPTLTNGANVADSTAFLGQYIRVGNVVQAGARIEVDPTAGTTITVISGTLPIASNFNNVIQCTGAGASVAGGCGEVRADATNDLFVYAFTSTGTASNAHYLTFTYLVI